MKPIAPEWSLDKVAGAAAFSWDSERLSFTGDRTMELWDVATRQPLASRPMTSSWSRMPICALPGQLAVGVGEVVERVSDQTLDTLELMERPAGRRSLPTICAVAALPDGVVVTGDSRGDSRLWIEGVAERRPFNPNPGSKRSMEVVGLCLSPDATELLTLHANGGALKVWELATRKCLRTLDLSSWMFAAHPSGAAVFTTDGSRVRGSRTADGALLGSFDLGAEESMGRMGSGPGLAVTSTHVVASNSSGELRVFALDPAWALPAGERVMASGCMAASPDGRWLAAWPAYFRMDLYDLKKLTAGA